MEVLLVKILQLNRTSFCPARWLNLHKKEMSEQNNFSCKKSKTLVPVVLTQAAEISLGWIERQVYVTWYLVWMSVCYGSQKIGSGWIWKKKISFGLCCICYFIWRKYTWKCYRKEKCRDALGTAMGVTAVKCKERCVHISVSSRECVV